MSDIKSGAAIEVFNLCKSYGSMHAVRDISFAVSKGEVIGFLGPNGAGKSTTIKIICGLLAANSGSVFINGVSVARYPEKIKNKIGYMPENNPLPEDMRIDEYLTYRAHLKGLSGSWVKDRVDHVLELCDLHRKAKSKIIATLSKGFRQRVGIADVLLAEPDLVIMDEPTIGLDPHQVLMMRKLIQNLKGKMTFVISSHILAEIEKICDRVIIINRGSIVASGSSAELRKEFIPVTGVKICIKGEVLSIYNEIRKNEKLVRYLEEWEDVLDSQEKHSGIAEIKLETYDWDRFRPWLRECIKNKTDTQLIEISRMESSLEDIFMAATKRSWDDEVDQVKTYLSEIA